MNCQTFESLINELADDRLMEATTRLSAQAHTENCQRCAARLADERVLTAGLRSLASRARTSEAPPRVETALLAAFRAQSAAQPSSQSVSGAQASQASAPVVQLATRRRVTPFRALATAAAAAAVILVFGFAGILRQQPREDAKHKAAQADASPSLTAATAPTAIGTTPNPVDSGSYAIEIDSPINTREVRRAEIASYSPRGTGARPSGEARYNKAGFNRNSGARPAAQANDAVAAEITTDFIPLTHGSSLAADDGGQVMRVELPRSALVSFGLPMNVERANERVKADVLMGEDGVARAIRFVR